MIRRIARRAGSIASGNILGRSSRGTGPVELLSPQEITRSASIPPSYTGTVVGITAGTGLTGGTITTSGTIALSVPVTVAHGGTNATSASGTALDNITGFASTGLMRRTGAGAYSFGTSVSNGELANSSITLNSHSLSLGGSLTLAFSDFAGTVSAAQLPNPSSSTLGGVESIAAVTHQFLTSISTSGVPSASQPAFTDISGTATVAQGGSGQTSYTDGQLLVGNSSGNTLTKATLTAGSGVSITNGGGSISISATGTGGTVTSVDMTVPTEITLSGNPITTSGTLALSWTNETTNKVFAAPSGSTGTPTFRALVGADLPNPGASSLGGVQSKAAVTSNFLTQISTSGVVSQAQPAFSDVSGTLATASQLDHNSVTINTHSLALNGSLTLAFSDFAGTVAASQLPNPGASTLGGVESYASVSHQFLTQISTSGVVSSAQPAFTDISGSVAAAQLPNPSSSTLGGVESYASVSHQFLTQISTSGVVSSAQPAFTDISGTATVGQGGTGQTSYTDGQLLIGNTTGNTLAKATLTAGSGISITNGSGTISIATTGGSGTVTSVDMSVPTEITLSGNPITTSGTLALSWTNETTNKVFAAPSGSTGTPTFRALVGADLPNPGASALGGVQSKASTTHQFLTQISTSGVVSAAQPAFTDVSGSVAASQLPNPTSSTLGGIESYVAVSHQWINTISTSGVPSSTQPDFSDLSGSIAPTQGGVYQIDLYANLSGV